MLHGARAGQQRNASPAPAINAHAGDLRLPCLDPGRAKSAPTGNSANGLVLPAGKGGFGSLASPLTVQGASLHSETQQHAQQSGWVSQGESSSLRRPMTMQGSPPQVRPRISRQSPRPMTSIGLGGRSTDMQEMRQSSSAPSLGVIATSSIATGSRNSSSLSRPESKCGSHISALSKAKSMKKSSSLAGDLPVGPNDSYAFSDSLPPAWSVSFSPFFSSPTTADNAPSSLAPSPEASWIQALASAPRGGNHSNLDPLLRVISLSEWLAGKFPLAETGPPRAERSSSEPRRRYMRKAEDVETFERYPCLAELFESAEGLGREKGIGGKRSPRQDRREWTKFLQSLCNVPGGENLSLEDVQEDFKIWRLYLHHRLARRRAMDIDLGIALPRGDRRHRGNTLSSDMKPEDVKGRKAKEKAAASRGGMISWADDMPAERFQGMGITGDLTSEATPEGGASLPGAGILAGGGGGGAGGGCGGGGAAAKSALGAALAEGSVEANALVDSETYEFDPDDPEKVRRAPEMRKPGQGQQQRRRTTLVGQTDDDDSKGSRPGSQRRTRIGKVDEIGFKMGGAVQEQSDEGEDEGDDGDEDQAKDSTSMRRRSSSWGVADEQTALFRTKVFPVSIHGATGSRANIVNGVFVPTEELVNRHVAYVKVGSDEKYWLCFDKKKRSWKVQLKASKGSSKGFLNAMNGDVPRPELAEEWAVLNDSKKWERQDSVVVSIIIPTTFMDAAKPLMIPAAESCMDAEEEDPQEEDHEGVVQSRTAALPALGSFSTTYQRTMAAEGFRAAVHAAWETLDKERADEEQPLIMRDGMNIVVEDTPKRKIKQKKDPKVRTFNLKGEARHVQQELYEMYLEDRAKKAMKFGDYRSRQRRTCNRLMAVLDTFDTGAAL